MSWIGTDLIISELDRCFDVTESQDQASEIERDMRQDCNVLAYVTRRKLHFQQLDNAVGTAPPPVKKGYAVPQKRKAPRMKLRHSRKVGW